MPSCSALPRSLIQQPLSQLLILNGSKEALTHRLISFGLHLYPFLLSDPFLDHWKLPWILFLEGQGLHHPGTEGGIIRRNTRQEESIEPDSWMDKGD